MTHQNFVHVRAIQPKNSISKYLKQAAMLSISLAAFCSYGSCGDVVEDVDNAVIGRVSSRDSLKSAPEIDVEISDKDIMINKIEQALSTLNASFKEDSLSRTSENDEEVLSLEDYITELDRSMESIVPNAQQKLEEIISRHQVSDHPITNAFSTVSFLASMRTLIVEQLLSMKKIGNYTDADTIGLEQYQKLNEAFQKHKNSIDLIANASWNDVSSVDDRSMDVQVGQHSVSITLSNLTVESLGIGDLNISDKYSAIKACDKIDDTLIQISLGIATLGGQIVRLRCATQIAAATDNTDYLSVMSHTIYAAKAHAHQSNTDTISPSQRAMLYLEYKAHLDSIDMLETTYDIVDGEFVYSVASLRNDGESSLYDQLKDTDISGKRSAGLAITGLDAASDQYRAQLERLLASLSDDSDSVDMQATHVSHEKID